MNIPTVNNYSRQWIRISFLAAVWGVILATFIIARLIGKLGTAPSFPLLLVSFIPLHGAGLGLFVYWTAKLGPRPVGDTLELSPKQPGSILKQFLCAVPVAAIFLPLSLFVSLVFSLLLKKIDIIPDPSPVFDFMTREKPGLLLAALAGVTIVAPISEEILFRFGLHDFLKSFKIPLPAIWVAALFAVIHGQIYAIPALFLLSLLLQTSRKLSGGMYSPMFIHGFYNLFATMLFLGANLLKDWLETVTPHV